MFKIAHRIRILCQGFAATHPWLLSIGPPGLDSFYDQFHDRNYLQWIYGEFPTFLKEVTAKTAKRFFFAVFAVQMSDFDHRGEQN